MKTENELATTDATHPSRMTTNLKCGMFPLETFEEIQNPNFDMISTHVRQWQSFSSLISN